MCFGIFGYYVCLINWKEELWLRIGVQILKFVAKIKGGAGKFENNSGHTLQTVRKKLSA